MKPIWFLAAACLLIWTGDIFYSLGGQKQREFKALCLTPGVRCVVEFAPAYLAQHSEVNLPLYVVGEFANTDGGLSGPRHCRAGELQICTEDEWVPVESAR